MTRQEIPLSLICVYNNQEQLNQLLKKSYKNQNVCCELVLIDNRKQKYKSAIDAIMAGLNKAQNDYILICHQDIFFSSTTTLKNIFKYLKRRKNQIIGTAGVTVNPREMYSSMLHGPNKKAVCPLKVEDEMEVFSLDECLFGFHKSILSKISFDKNTCDNWHFYAVDLCYQAHLNNIKVMCINALVWHASDGKSGSKSKTFYDTVCKMQKKYQDIYPAIDSCCIHIGIHENANWHALKRKLTNQKIKDFYVRYRWSINKRLEQWRK